MSDFDITKKIKEFAFTNSNMIKGEPKGIVLRLRGLTLDIPLLELVREGRRYAKEQMLFIYPYTAPWSWMNDETVELIDTVLEVYCGDRTIPIVAYGHSLGGYGAITYSVKGKYPISACVAVCPICDLTYHSTEHSGTLVSMYYAYRHNKGTLEDIMFRQSPINFVSDLPYIPYLVIYCMKDKQVNSEKHVVPFIEKCIRFGLNVITIAEEGAHCELSSETESEIFHFICENGIKE